MSKLVPAWTYQTGDVAISNGNGAEDQMTPLQVGDKVFEDLSKKWDGLDCIVHSVGFAPGDQLDGDFTDATTRIRANLKTW